MARIRQNKTHLFALLAAVLWMGLPPAQARAAQSPDEVVLDGGADVVLLTQADLSQDRGTGDASNGVVSTQSLAATTTGNTLSVAGNLVNGNINFGSDFGGSGFGSYVMNTGNNSTLTAATSVTIQMGTP